jgi:hypothetical protein
MVEQMVIEQPWQPDEHPPPNLDQFHQLLRKLVRVPKADVDAEVRKERAAKRKSTGREK